MILNVDMRRRKGKRHQESDVLKLTLYPADKSLVQPIPLGPLDFETIHTEKRFTVMFIPEYIVWALTKVSLSSGMIHELPDFIKGGITTCVHPALDPGDLFIHSRDKGQDLYKIGNLLTLNCQVQGAGKQQTEEQSPFH